MRFLFLFLLALAAAGCGSTATTSTNSRVNATSNTNVVKKSASVPVWTYEVVNKYPHDPKAFTQGLIYQNGFLYESTGQEGASTLRKVDLQTGKVVQKHNLPKEVFGEGLAVIGDKAYQLSWRNGTGWVYDLDSFRLLREFRYPGEGWGLTSDGTNLFMSDGTHVIRVIDPTDFQQVRTIVVKDETGRPLMKINELEWVNGEIWANIWHSEEIGKPNHIARIDPATGNVIGWIDLGNISPEDQLGEEKIENTLNGIAYDPTSQRIFVTGKNWKNLYEIKLKPKN